MNDREPVNEAVKTYNKQKRLLADRMRHDGRLTSATRTVGAEIASLVNFNTGYAWSDQDYLVEKLGLGMRTVKRAIGTLVEAGYFTIEKVGRKNRYRPNFDAGQVPNWHLSETQQVPNWHQSEDDRCQKVPQQVPKSASNRCQNGPLISLDISSRSQRLSAGRSGAPDGAAAPASESQRPTAADAPDRLGGFFFQLEDRLGKDVFASWLANAAFIAEDGDLVTIAASTKFKATYIRTHFTEAILEVWQTRRPHIQRLNVVVAAGVATVAPAPKPAEARGNVASIDNHPARGDVEDARWLLDIGIGLVSDALHVSAITAQKTIKAWLQRCGNDAAGLRRLIADGVARGLSENDLRDVVRAGTKQLLFKDQLPLKGLTFVNVKRSAS